MKAVSAPVRIKISPRIATELLERHEAIVRARGDKKLNRKINDNRVTTYGRDMANGKWDINGETIKIAATGRILDGQHRLWAAVNHEQSFETYVVTGLDEETFYTIDIGRTRRPSDFLVVDGVPCGSVVASAARIIIGYRQRDLKNVHLMPSHEIVEFAKANPRLAESASKVHGCNKLGPLSCIAAWHFLFTETSPEQADQFLEEIRDGVGLEKGSPVLALRERLLKNRASKAKLSARELFIIGIRSWNDFRSGKRRMITKVLTAAEADLPKVA